MVRPTEHSKYVACTTAIKARLPPLPVCAVRLAASGVENATRAQQTRLQHRGSWTIDFLGGLDVVMDAVAMSVVVGDSEVIKAVCSRTSRLRRTAMKRSRCGCVWGRSDPANSIHLETLHVPPALKARVNKTGKADALGIATHPHPLVPTRPHQK